jgi:hypothetical protein
MIKTLLTLALASVVTFAGCANPAADVENVPVGSDVELVRQDGGVVRGTLAARDESSVKVEAGATSRSIPRNEIAELHVVDPAKPTPLPAVAKFRELTLPEGTKLAVRLESTVGSDASRVESPVEATLSEAVVVDGIDVFPGAPAFWRRPRKARTPPRSGSLRPAARSSAASSAGRRARRSVRRLAEVVALRSCCQPPATRSGWRAAPR